MTPTGPLRSHAAGSGPPLVLLHPGPGLDGAALAPFFAALHDRHTVVALDLHSGDPANWTLDGAADEVRATADALGLRDYTLLGHSFGGMVALHHAVSFPGHAARLVISQSVADEACFDGLEAALTAFGSERVVEAFEREGTVTTPDELRDVWLDQLPFFVAEPGGAGEAALGAALREVTYSVDAARHEDWGDHDLTGSLGAIGVPALVVAGAEDRMMPPPFVGAVAEGIGGAELVVIDAAGHFAFAEQPEAYLAAVARFIA